MLERIPREQVRLGMYIQAIEGPWLNHPFWKSKFLLSDPSDLQALLDSDIHAVLIDAAKGVGARASPEPPEQPCHIDAGKSDGAQPPRAVKARKAAQPRPATSLALLEPCSAAEELQRASLIVERSKEAVRLLFDDVRLGKAVDIGRTMPFVEEISASVTRNPSALISVARLKSKDEYTYLHSVAVCALMINLGRQLKLDEAVIRDVGVAGLLHDVGKVAMPNRVLNKPAKLSDSEFAIMKKHPRAGWEVLRDRGDVPEIALEVCLHHHERMDGTGYPDGLKGEEISLYARMGAVCDVYDAVTSNRPYKEAWGAADSLTRMFGWKGHFDPEVLAAFIRSVGIYPVGTLVRLRSDRLGLVIDQNPADLTKPVVRAFWSAGSRGPIPILDLDLAAPGGEDEIVSREAPERWGLTPWGPRWLQLAGEETGTVGQPPSS